MSEIEKTRLKMLKLVVPIILVVSLASMGTSLQVLSCKTVNGSVPDGYTDLLGMSDSSNAHAELPSENNYEYRVVCTDRFNYTRVENSDEGREFARLSSETNAHAGTSEDSGYGESAYLDSDSSEVHVNISYPTGSCGESYECMATLSDSDNAHVASCNDNPYDLKICGRLVDHEPPEVSCDNCISSRTAEVGQQIEIEPGVEDNGFGVDSVEVCFDRQCSEVICGSSNCTFVPETSENRDVYVRALDRDGNSVTERVGGLFIGLPLGSSCSEDSQCISGNCEDGVCSAQQVPPDVKFTQSGGEIDSLQMGILEMKTVNISISNFLPFPDTARLTFGGRAANGLVSGKVSETSGVDCNSDSSVCNVSISPDTTKDVEAEISGLSAGSGALTISAKSYATDLEAKDRIEINTRPRTEEGPVSAPALTMPYLILLLFMASTYFYLRLER